MTEKNCRKYMEEATDEKTKLFWRLRLERKYPQVKEVKEVEEKPKVKKKKEEKEDDSR